MNFAAIVSLKLFGSLDYHTIIEDNISIPTPVLVMQDSLTPSKPLEIDRIAGCYGDIAKARKNVRSSYKLLADPTFYEEEYTPSIFALTKDNPTCVIGDEPLPMESYEGVITSLWAYAEQVYECECGNCVDGDEHFDSYEIRDRITDKIYKDHDAYVLQREKEIQEAKKQYQLYIDDYNAWNKTRASELSPLAIKMQFTPEEDIAAGYFTAYNFVWIEARYTCDSLDRAERFELNARTFAHPPIKAGQSLDMWFEDVDISLSWGFIFHTSKEAADVDLERIQERTENIRLEHNKESATDLLPLRSMPPYLEGRVYETPKAKSSQYMSDCGCSC